MTEHVVQFAVGIDDDAIIKSVEASAKNQIIDDIKTSVLRKLFEHKYYRTSSVVHNTGSGVEVDRDAVLTDFAEGMVMKSIDSYREEIINRTAKILADKIGRSKKFKDVVDGTVDDNG